MGTMERQNRNYVQTLNEIEPPARNLLSYLWAHAVSLSLSLRHAYLRIISSAQWFDLFWFAKPPQ